MARTQESLRAVALLLLGALAVHWSRYLLAYGDAADRELAAQGHGYLSELLPAMAVLCVALIAGSGAIRVLEKASGDRRARRNTAALLFAGGLLTIYGAQELSEGLLSPGHRSGLAALTANGGWVAAPLALLFGGVLSLLAWILDGAEDRVVRFLSRSTRTRPAPAIAPRPAPTPASRLAQGSLAFGFARRPPPAPLSQ